MDDVELTGGCQCGAIRYALGQRPHNVHVCHCRMCQKAVGGPFAIICPVLKAAFRITRGEISYFKSSDVGRRGFCISNSAVVSEAEFSLMFGLH